MKIDAIDIPKEFQQELGNYLGLEDIKMSRLGRLVVVAGANGSGKSRLLTLLNNQTQARQNLDANIEQAAKYQNAINNQPTSPHVINWSNACISATRVVRLFEAIKNNDNSQISPAVYNTKNLHLNSANSFGSEQLNSHADMLRQVGISGFPQVTSYVLSIFQRAVYATSSQATTSAEEVDLATNTKELLVTLIHQLLGADSNASFNIGGYVTLFGHKDYEVKLSDGQKIILQLACALHAQNTKLSEAIIFFDEPENHLHPAAMIDLINRLEGLMSNGQLWIATHSVPLIAHLAKKDPSCLWYMENGSVQHAGRKPELVLQGLMGGQAGVQALQDFTLLPSQLAINRFLAECLNPPTTVSASVNDPQTSAITRKVYELRSALKFGETLRVLDYGAGKGRLLDALQAIDPNADLKTWLDYRAYDPSDDDKDICLETICRSYDTADRRYFNALSGVGSLSTETNDGTYDLIVMCNVLHEIHPNDWLDCFGNTSKSRLTNLLKSNGGLLIVEDYQIPTGELAHKHGFFLLNQPELQALFAWKESDQLNFIRDSEASVYKDRLVMHWVAQPLLKRVTPETRYKAIETLKDNANDAIDSLQAKSTSVETFSRGHQIALASQTFTNASRWLEKNPK